MRTSQQADFPKSMLATVIVCSLLKESDSVLVAFFGSCFIDPRRIVKGPLFKFMGPDIAAMFLAMFALLAGSS